MNPSSLDIDSLTHSICLLLGIRLLGIGDGQLALGDQVGSQASVGVWAVMVVSVAMLLSALLLRKGRS